MLWLDKIMLSISDLYTVLHSTLSTVNTQDSEVVVPEATKWELVHAGWQVCVVTTNCFLKHLNQQLSIINWEITQ